MNNDSVVARHIGNIYEVEYFKGFSSEKKLTFRDFNSMFRVWKSSPRNYDTEYTYVNNYDWTDEELEALNNHGNQVWE